MIYDVQDVVELLTTALREDALIGRGGRAVMRWTGVDRVLLARDRLAIVPDWKGIAEQLAAALTGTPAPGGICQLTDEQHAALATYHEARRARDES